jgi:hypothetical protein
MLAVFAHATVEKFGIQTEKGRVIWAFQNGDKHHKGVKFVIHAKKYKTLEQVKIQMSSQLALPTGPVQRIYRFQSLSEKHVEVKDVSEFEDGANYLVCGPEPFNKAAGIPLFRSLGLCLAVLLDLATL